MPADETQYAAGAARGTLTRGFERGAATRAGLLAAAREVFTPVGYTAAAIVLIGALMLAVAEVSPGGDQAAAGALADGVLSVIGRIDTTSRG